MIPAVRSTIQLFVVNVSLNSFLQISPSKQVCAKPQTFHPQPNYYKLVKLESFE